MTTHTNAVCPDPAAASAAPPADNPQADTTLPANTESDAKALPLKWVGEAGPEINSVSGRR